MKLCKKLFPCFIAVAVVLSYFFAFPINANAASGFTGDCKWELEGTTLTISGNGRMENYSANYRPWESSVTHVVIEEGVTHIGQWAFFRCPLESVSIASSVRTIGTNAFQSSSLTQITIPEGVTGIGDGAFCDCFNLKETNLPSTLKSIGEWAFQSCKIKSIVLPAGIETIGKYAFNYCSIENIWYLGSESDKANISIGSSNACLNTATWHYNSCPIGAPHAYDGVCDSDCNGCGKYRDVPEHTYDNSCDSSCNGCGELRTVPNHVYNNDCDTTCNVCGDTRAVSHQYDQEWIMTKTNHWHECSICGVKKDEATHAYDNACDTTCNTCGYTRTITHSYKTEWFKDGSKHWHECSICGEQKDVKAHTPGAAATETTAQTCTTCGYVIKAALGHTHNFVTTWSKDSSSHWHACGCGSQQDIAPHSYTNSCDTDCNTCGYTRTITHTYAQTWTTSSEKHWHACTVCGNKSNEAAHTPGAAATETTAQTCTTCGYVIKAALGHTHNFATTWTTDNNGHWHACAGCGEKGSYAAHTWNGNSCAVCGANNPNATQPTDPTEPSTEPSTNPTEPSTNPSAPSEPSTQPSEPSTPTTPSTVPSSGSTEPTVAPTEPQEPVDNDEDGNNTWIVLLVVGIVFVVGGIAAGVIISKKKR